MTNDVAALRLPDRPADGHKGTFGRVLIVAGSRGMSGAAALAGMGALRGGAGLVYLAVPTGIVPIVAAMEPSYLTVPLPEDKSGKLSIAAYPHVTDRGQFMDAVAIGPGWGQSDELRRIAGRLYAELKCPVVVDADALNLLAGDPGSIATHDGPRILTPHPGEFATLRNCEITDVQSDRRGHAESFAATHGVVVVLKGRESIITDGQTTYVNPTGNSGMATGGTGDVLTGIITALLAQGLPPLEAARTGAYLHGLAGDLAAAHFSEPGLIASDLPRYLGRAWMVLLGAAPSNAGHSLRE